MVYDRLRDKEGKPLFGERQILEYIEEQCGYEVMKFVEELIEDNGELQDQVQELEDRNDDWY